MVVGEFAVSSELFPALVCGEQTIWNHLWVELHLGPSDGVNERSNDLEECVDEEWKVDDYSSTEVLGIVGLKNVENLFEEGTHWHMDGGRRARILTVREVEMDGFLARSAKLIIRVSVLSKECQLGFCGE